MIPSAEDAQRRAFQQRNRALSHAAATGYGEATATPAAVGSPTTMMMRDGSSQSIGNGIYNSSHNRPSAAALDSHQDHEFEEFHRSFGSNPLEMMINNSSSNSNNGINVATTSSEAATPQHHLRLSVELQQQQQPLAISASGEDPAVAQARRSMLARTGDRHARGKLPEASEGNFQPPHSAPEEPKIPPPKGSKRFVKQKERIPDILTGTLLLPAETENQDNSNNNNDNGGKKKASRVKDDDHVVTCGKCQKRLVVKKAAVLVRCEVCQAISSASSEKKGSSSYAAAPR